MLLDDEASFDLMESIGYGGGRYSAEELKTIYTRLKLETVAACQDARLNRQTSMMLALAVSLAAFGAGFSLSHTRAETAGVVESGAEESGAAESNMEDEGE